MKHPIFWFWALYFIGQFLNTLTRSAAVVNSTISGINTYRLFLALHWKNIVGRVFAATCGMLILKADPELFWRLLGRGIGVEINNIPTINPVVAAGIAGLLGYTADSIIEKVAVIFWPAARQEIPPAGGN
jgi:hypothetical protein